MPMFAVKDLAIHFGGIKAVDGVSFEVEQGSIFTIIGPNGAGKTTIFNLVSRINNPTAGQIFLDGRDITRVPANRVARLGVARTFQNIELFDNASVLQNIMVGRHIHIGTNLVSEMLRLPSVAREEMAARRRVEEIIEFLGLSTHRDSPVGGLSYGVRKMVELGRALACEPRLLLLDEPSSGLNVEETDNIGLWIRDVRDTLGITVLMVEHDMRLVSAVSDRVMALNYGRLLAIGTAAEVQRDPAVISAYLGN
ncbi:MAG TPA: ABC transporter ATP-binding protein [Burkholderiales bacterium]|nr:ABC transporter ATP-binding protein [Burkholderiales bacterium]